MKTNLFLLLTFFLSSLAFPDGTWNGGISVNKDKVVAGGSVTATVSATYQPDDPDIQQEIEEGEATIEYEYFWTSSGEIISGGGIENTTCTVQFSSPSSSVNSDWIKCEVVAKVIYTDQEGNKSQVDSSSITYEARITVFKVEIKDGNGTDEPERYIPEGGSKSYKAVVYPSGLSGSYSWLVENTNPDSCIEPLSGTGETFTANGNKVGSANLKVEFTPQTNVGADTGTDSITLNVFRPDIEIGLSEETEEETGAYIELKHTRSCTLKIEGSLPENETITLSCNNSSKMSLWSGSTQLSFPYSCSVSSLPKTLTLKGEETSTTIKDITLTLTTSKGGDDKANITVFDIDLDWEGLNEETEDETGIYIPLNVDDDNSDTTLDKDQYPVYKENDLKKLIVRKPSPSNLPKSIFLTISSGSDKIKIWEDTVTETEKIIQVTSRNYNISDELQSDTWLWVEGYNLSSTKGIEIKITYNAPDGTFAEDKVKATVTIGSVLLDPGHGGSDSGAIGPTGLKEKDVNLDIALKLKEKLQNIGLTVYMTRESDVYLSLDTRNETTIYYKPTFFFSIHNNSCDDSSVRGTETYTPVDFYQLEDIFAHEIQNKVHSVVLEQDRGVKRANFQVLRHDLNGYTDGNLNEVTFISNPISESRLRQESFREAVAEAMKKAILKVLVEDINYPKQPNQ